MYVLKRLVRSQKPQKITVSGKMDVIHCFSQMTYFLRHIMSIWKLLKMLLQHCIKLCSITFCESVFCDNTQIFHNSTFMQKHWSSVQENGICNRLSLHHHLVQYHIFIFFHGAQSLKAVIYIFVIYEGKGKKR